MEDDGCEDEEAEEYDLNKKADLDDAFPVFDLVCFAAGLESRTCSSVYISFCPPQSLI